VRGVALPSAVFQYPDPLAALKAHLGGQLSALLAAVIKLRRQFGIEKHHRFGGVESTFGAAETQNIDTGAPGDVRGAGPAHAQRGQGVGKTGTVHVQRQIVGTR
jgi:hypothetical protein